MGTAEGGYKITLYNVNNLGVADGGYGVPLDDYDALNKWYFTTLHHEFQHILNQKKPYDPTFDLISEGDYVSGDWYQYNTNTQALPKGFIRNYAMVEPREDYAELYSQYLTNNDALWASKMEYAGKRVRLSSSRNWLISATTCVRTGISTWRRCVHVFSVVPQSI